MPQLEAILFDVDGTLIDSAPGIIYTLTQVFQEMNVDTKNINLMQYVGPPLRVSFANHFSTEAEIEQATARYREIYKETGSHLSALYPGVKEMLDTLQGAGFTLCTATSKPTGVVTPILERLGIADYFAVIGGASMDKTRDNKTAVIQYVLEQPALCAKSAVMIGDRREDLQGAVDCNLPAIAVQYGYGVPAEFTPFQLLFLADSCKELTRYLLTTVRLSTMQQCAT